MGFLRMDADGTTTLNILNPDNSGYVNDKERVITLGEKVNRLKAGNVLSTHSIPFINIQCQSWAPVMGMFRKACDVGSARKQGIN